ncbi:hypothetical protein Tco_0894320 [Tanacetum coccineum]|uniref:Uncharacterized protein n=1 Tax=Tanacetum coccineum TaxID=301880 RepID=A0ABQ5CCN8_9ASTR
MWISLILTLILLRTDEDFPSLVTFVSIVEWQSHTTSVELSLQINKAFYIDNDHFKEKSSGSTTTHVDFSQYDSFIFDLSNDQFPPADRSDDFYHEEFAENRSIHISTELIVFFKMSRAGVVSQ